MFIILYIKMAKCFFLLVSRSSHVERQTERQRDRERQRQRQRDRDRERQRDRDRETETEAERGRETDRKDGVEMTCSISLRSRECTVFVLMMILLLIF